MSKNVEKVYSHDGYTLVGVLLTIVIISVVGLSLVTIAFASLNVSSGERDDQSAFYIAEAGLTHVMSEVEEMAYKIYERTETKEQFFEEFDQYIDTDRETYDDFELVYQNQPKAEIATYGEFGEYVITSTGEIGNKNRTVQGSFNLEWSSKGNSGLQLPEFVIFAQEDIKMHHHTKVEGEIGTVNGTVPNNFNNAYIGEDDHEFPTDYNFHAPPINFEDASGNRTVKSDFILTELQSYENLTFEGKDITIKTGDTDKVIVTKNLEFKHSEVTIEGQGKLTIFVQNLNLQQNILNKEGNPDQLDIMYYPNNTGRFHIKNKVTVIGNIFTNTTEIKVGGNHQYLEGLIFAPYATIDFSGDLLGSLVVKSVKDTDNDSNIIYKPYEVDGESIDDEGKTNGVKMKKTSIIEK